MLESQMILTSSSKEAFVMGENKNPHDMTLEELIEYRRGTKMTEEEMRNQDIAIAAAEARHAGDKTATRETVRTAIEQNKTQSIFTD